MILIHYKKMLVGSMIAISLIMAGCGSSSDSAMALPEAGPEVVAGKFLNYISEAKIRGGSSPAKEAFKLIDSESANLNVHQFLEIIKSYPPGFMAEVGKVEIKGTQAIVDITYKMPSTFGGTYDVKGAIPLNLDKNTNTWKIDFVGDTYGVQKDDLLAKKPD